MGGQPRKIVAGTLFFSGYSRPFSRAASLGKRAAVGVLRGPRPVAAPRAVPRCDLGAMSSVLPKAGRRKNGGLRCRDGRTWGVSFFFFPGGDNKKCFDFLGNLLLCRFSASENKRWGLSRSEGRGQSPYLRFPLSSRDNNPRRSTLYPMKRHRTCFRRYLLVQEKPINA